ncbi:MAG TPA: sulfate reduction electron transfer complex DsrMKJOP subunit DsrM [Nitrospirota bacterium]|nr:sulfate reduction electron transfer complex DsrMKJOP subunit DsrM [Nitrospirota bacterium]HYQ47613.1 sulfate reduction electron transfer complex DsrMKJOP subunit DsrM [Thermodesulfovibrionales bacterium]
MKALVSLIAVLLLVLIAYAGVAAANLRFLFGVIIPYAAFLMFVVGMIVRVLKWGSSPVPFRIPSTCGQQKSLPWIKHSKLENPSGALGVIGRMALEVLFFRSLFRNLKTQLNGGGNIAYGEAKWLWLAGMAFHWSFLIILFRHMRFFIEKIPAAVQLAEGLDSFLQIGAPLLYLTDVFLILAVTYLFIRRIGMPQVRYISLIADYFPLFLILGIAVSGVLMRYFYKTDIVSVKVLAMGLISFKPAMPAETIGVIFYIHLFLLSVLFAYFPMSKLVHMGGVFLSPTRNMANNNRMKRHVNPWNYPVHVHTYEEYENDFRDKMKNAGIPVEKE